MFAKQLIRLSHVAFGAAILGVTVIATPAQAADPVTPTASVMNQSNGVYEETLKFYLHPARLEVTEAPRERMDHPAVIIARRPKADFDWTSAFILHPARLAVTSQEPKPATTQPAVRIAKGK
jgi:hypothetical protein